MDLFNFFIFCQDVGINFEEVVTMYKDFIRHWRIHCDKMVKYVQPFCPVSDPALADAVLMTVSGNLERGLQSSMGTADSILESPQELYGILMSGSHPQSA